MKRLSITGLSYYVMGYMILAFSWWSLHLWRQNERVFERDKNLITLQHPGLDIRQLPDYDRAKNHWKSGRRMVLAEGVFFTACLVFGLWVIRRSASREVSLARQRRNFLLSITHELKSPIASMRLVFETLGRPQLQPEQRARLLQNGLKDADRLQNLVESLLLAARLEDKWRPLPEPLDFAAIARDAAESLRIRFPQADFRLEIPTALPPVQADKMGLAAIVQNLLENAVKYAPENAPVVVSAEQTNGKFRFRVADQGQGIPDSEKRSVFEKFYRMGNEETRHSTGTGLGLYIVKQVTEAHGGQVRVFDNTPQGTVFEIEF